MISYLLQTKYPKIFSTTIITEYKKYQNTNNTPCNQVLRWPETRHVSSHVNYLAFVVEMLSSRFLFSVSKFLLDAWSSRQD